jgi:capsid protein
LAIEYARQGRDWEEQLRQRAAEVALMRELGLNLADAQPDTDPNQEDTDVEDPAQAA